jgi:hypothetical protein
VGPAPQSNIPFLLDGGDFCYRLAISIRGYDQTGELGFIQVLREYICREISPTGVLRPPRSLYVTQGDVTSEILTHGRLLWVERHEDNRRPIYMITDVRQPDPCAVHYPY